MQLSFAARGQHSLLAMRNSHSSKRAYGMAAAGAVWPLSSASISNSTFVNHDLFTRLGLKERKSNKAAADKSTHECMHPQRPQGRRA